MTSGSRVARNGNNGVIEIAGSNHASWNLFSNSLRGQIISPRVGFEFCGQGITLNQSAIFFFLFSFFGSFKFSLCFTVRSTRFFLRFLFPLSLVHKISLVKMAFSEYFLTILQGIEKNKTTVDTQTDRHCWDGTRCPF